MKYTLLQFQKVIHYPSGRIISLSSLRLYLKNLKIRPEKRVRVIDSEHKCMVNYYTEQDAQKLLDYVNKYGRYKMGV